MGGLADLKWNDPWKSSSIGRKTSQESLYTERDQARLKTCTVKNY